MALVLLFSKRPKIFKKTKRDLLAPLAFCLITVMLAPTATADVILSKQLATIFKKSKKRIWIYSKAIDHIPQLSPLLLERKSQDIDVRIMSATTLKISQKMALLHKQALLPYRTTIISDRYVWQMNCDFSSEAMAKPLCELQKPAKQASLLYKRFLQTWMQVPHSLPMSAQTFNYDQQPKSYRAPVGLPTKLPQETISQRKRRLARQKAAYSIVEDRRIPHVPFYKAPFSSESY